MSIHSNPHPLTGQAVTVDADLHADGPGPHQVLVEDWWDRVFVRSWMVADGNPAALIYALRSSQAGLPTDNNVIYGKTPSGRGHLLHVSELQSGGAE